MDRFDRHAVAGSFSRGQSTPLVGRTIVPTHANEYHGVTKEKRRILQRQIVISIIIIIIMIIIIVIVIVIIISIINNNSTNRRPKTMMIPKPKTQDPG